MHLADPVPELYRFHKRIRSAALSLDQDFDLAFVLDVGEFRRAGKQFGAFNRIGQTINLDHHLTCEHFGNLNLIDEQAAATGLLVWRVAKAYGFTADWRYSPLSLCGGADR